MPLAAARRIDLGCKRLDPISLVAPFEDLMALARNAIDNALRYTPAGGTVDVSLYEDDSEVVFLVEDTGAGIPAGEERSACSSHSIGCQEMSRPGAAWDWPLFAVLPIGWAVRPHSKTPRGRTRAHAFAIGNPY